VSQWINIDPSYVCTSGGMTISAQPGIPFQLQVSANCGILWELNFGANTAQYNTTLTKGAWYYVAGVFNGTTLTLYLNGASVATGSWTGSIGSISQVGIGDWTYNGFTGKIDETRISNIARSADWIKTEYNNQSAPGSFASFGPQLDQNTLSVLLTSDPGGATLTVDGSACTAPCAQAWSAGSVHTIAAAGQSIGGAAYVFAGWSDAGAASHTITASSATLSYNVSLNAAPGTVYTTRASGNWSARATWNPDPGPGYSPCAGTAGGDKARITHSVTVDLSVDCGDSPPATPYHTSQQITGVAAGSGGSLPAGTYALAYTLVDSNGVESAQSPAWGGVSVGAGGRITVTFPALPAGAVARNLYVSPANIWPDAMPLYATGITSASYVMSSASWNNGTQASGAAPVLATQGAAILWAGGSLTVGSAVTVRVRGDFRAPVSNLTFTQQPGSSLLFDASAALVPANARYVWVLGTYQSPYVAWTWDATTCTALSPCAIGSNPAGAFAYTAGAGINLSGTVYTTRNTIPVCKLSYLTVDAMGTFNDASLICGSNSNSAAHANTLFEVIFGGSAPTGFLDMAFGGTSDSFNLQNVSFKNSAGNYSFLQSSDNVGGTITVNHTFIDKPLILAGAALSIVGGSVLYSGPTINGAPMTVTDSLVRVWWPVSQQPVNYMLTGTATNDYILADDNWEDDASRQVWSGRVSNATSTTLTDGGASWLPGAFIPNGTNSWSDLIVSGTGAGQVRLILNNTANQLTIAMPWVIQPDSTSVHQVWIGAGHQHTLNQMDSSTFSNVIWDYTGTNYFNHCTTFATGTATVNMMIQNNISVPGISGAGGCNFNAGTSSPSSSTLVFNHNTVTYENEANDYPAQSGAVTSFKANLFFTLPGWITPGILFWNEDTSPGPCTQAPQDQLATGAADYNYAYNGSDGSCVSTAGKGYQLYLSQAAGAHDVRQSGGALAAGPNFAGCVDGDINVHCRNFYYWALSNGSSGGYVAALRDALQKMKTMNDFVNPTTTYTVGSLLAWVRSGYAPRNPALNFTYPGDPNAVRNIGAVSGMFTAFPPGVFHRPVIW
jgi:hypothetical protein